MELSHRALERRSLGVGILVAAGVGFAPSWSIASGRFPARPIKLVVPFAAGGAPDLFARRQAPELGRVLDGQVVIENQAGAGGSIAAERVARAAPDGYTLLFGTSSQLISRFLMPKTAPDPLGSFAPISLSWRSPSLLVVAAGSPITGVDELVAAARSRPGQMNFGSGGIGTAAHLAGATFSKIFGLAVLHVPYRGAVELLPALVEDQVQFAFPVAAAVLPAVQQGRLRALAVVGAKRLAVLPNVPALAEFHPSELLQQEAWGGLWAPRETPPDIIATLFRAHEAANGSSLVRAFYEANAVEPALSISPTQFRKFMGAEMVKWRRIVALAGVSAS